MKKYVITGGPSVGKTTIIEILAARGCAIVPEAARIIIEEEQLKESSEALPWKDLGEFQNLVLQRQLKLEAEAKGNTVYCDRGIVDGYAYCTYGNVPIPPQIFTLGENRYTQIFLLETLGIYEKDGVRERTLEQAEVIHQHIEKAYIKFGYDLIRVPVLPPEERTSFIQERVC